MLHVLDPEATASSIQAKVKLGATTSCDSSPVPCDNQNRVLQLIMTNPGINLGAGTLNPAFPVDGPVTDSRRVNLSADLPCSAATKQHL